MDDRCQLSLILPAYNEEAGIAEAVVEADAALQKLGLSYEIIVVDDGCRDRTAAIVEQTIHDRPRVRLVRHGVNLGYGTALRTGFEAARGERIAFTDADCQFDLADLGLLLPLTEQHSIAVGYRVDRQDPWLRKFYSQGYNFIARTLLGTTVRDIDCALKVYRRDALLKVLPKTGGFFVNTEMLTKARQQRMSIVEVGVRHRPRQHGESKVSIADIPRTLNTLLPFWWTKVMFPGTPESTAFCEGRLNGGLQALLMFLLLVMTGALFFARIDHALLEPDEARYAEIPRQMLLEGRLLTPVLHGEDYWQKPPLLYWLVMLSYKTFGIHDWAARLIPCLAGIFSVVITTAWAWRTLGFWSGLVSGAILALSARFLYLGGMLSMDGLLCTFVVAGLACGHLVLTNVRHRRTWLLLSALACALGILTKGPVAILLIVVPLVALAFLDRRCRFATTLEGTAYLALVALLAGPWYVVMAAQAPAAAGSFVWVHHVVRYLAPIDHEKPAWFYVPSLLLGMLPWTLLLVPLVPYLMRKTKRAGERRPAALGAFVLSFAWCVLFFSLSGCKRPAYILPALPLLALIIGTFVTHGLPWQYWMQAWQAEPLGHRWARRLAVATLGMGAVISLAAGVSALWPWPESAWASFLFVGAAVLVAWAPLRGPAWSSWAGCAAVSFVLLGFAQRVVLPDYHERFGLRRQAEIAAEYEQEERLPIITYPKRWDSIGFYTRGVQIDSYTPAELAKLMHDLQVHGKAIVFVRREESLRELQQALPDHLEVELLGRDQDYVVVGLVRPKAK